jgi:hypothetical protein
MPKVTIVKPNPAPEEKEKILKNIAFVLEKIVCEEFGVTTKCTVTIKNEYELKFNRKYENLA